MSRTLHGLLVLLWVFAPAIAQTPNTFLELEELDRLQREVALVREYTEQLQGRHGVQKRLSFRYQDLIVRLRTIETDISAHIDYANASPQWERFGE